MKKVKFIGNEHTQRELNEIATQIEREQWSGHSSTTYHLEDGHKFGNIATVLQKNKFNVIPVYDEQTGMNRAIHISW